MELVVASNNAHKIKEIREILGDSFERIYSLSDLGLAIDVVEDGTTFAENALKKAKEVCQVAKMPALADDTGLSVDALGGAPGVYSARYAGVHGDDEANNRKLLKELEKTENRSARFITAVALYYPDGKFILGRGAAEGTILRQKLGKNGFGYDALFLSADLDKTFGEAEDAEKNAVSHRARALYDLMRKL